MSSAPQLDEIYDIAGRAIDIFNSYGLRCCLFGSAGCSLYGTSRTPNDLDLIVLTDEYDTEELKHYLVADDEDFFLVPSNNSRATYEVLWCDLPSHGRQRRACKVDILIPGVLNIPYVPDGQEDVINNLPVMPIMPLLLLKLQGWSDHRASPRADMQEKQYVDVEDIKELLAIACELEQDAYQANLMWIPVEFLDDTQERVYDFLEEFGDTAFSWDLVGFNV